MLGALVIGLLILAIVATLVIGSSIPKSFQRESGGGLTDLTGRPEFWKAAWIMFKERPFHGYGYEVAGRIWEDPRFFRPGYRLWSGSARTSLHDGYLSVTLGLGIPGLLIWLAILFSPFRFLRLILARPEGLVCVVIMTELLVLNFVEDAISTSRGLGSLVFWVFWLVAQVLGRAFPDEQA